MIDDPELFKLFKAESSEHLARLDDGLLRLEKTPADPALLEEVFRESHSLKGAARMLGLAKIESTAHGLESIFNAARKGETPLTPETIEHMNAALGDLRLRVQEALSGVLSGECTTELLSEVQTPDATLPSPSGGSEFGRSGFIPTGSLDKGKSVGMYPQGVGRDCKGLKPQQHTLNPDLQELEVHGKEVQAISSKPTPAASEPFRIDTVRVETRKLDDMLTQVGELSVIQGRAQHRLALMEEVLERWSALERSRRNGNAGSFTRHGVGGEASARFGSLLKQSRDALFTDSARLESTVNLLEDQVRNIRLLPLSTVFSLFPRMVRDLTKEQGKEAELTLEGGDITVDKRILEEMKDPLMHLIRNAIDHGIELPAERERVGKPRSGSVLLRAVRENACVLLEVQDDGRGLDSATIRQEAKKRGLQDEAALAAMTPAQLQQLIFIPGFSTSTYVTELSGRGVGLDVVRVNVERMKGSVRLDSTPANGLTVQVRLPLSLATTRLLLASVNGQLFGLPVEFVQTSQRVREKDIFTLEGRLAVQIDGQPVIAARLADLLALEAEGSSLAVPGILACVVLQAGDERLSLLVDDLIGEEEVVPKPLGMPLQRVRNVSALAMLGSGDICAVLNPADLLRSAHKTSAELGLRNAELSSHSAIGTPHSKPGILLVEDSALIRAMEKRILEDNGYEVVTAVDGVDALNALGNHAFAAVVSDIMMPNMNGLTLTTHIRAEPRYKELPIILVTSLASNEDKRRGLDAGANAYIPKPSFDQRVLLDTLKRLIVT